MKKRISFISLFLASLLLMTCSARGDFKILALYSANYGPNSYFTGDDLARYGWEITTAGLTKTVSRCPSAKYIPAFTVDTLISNIADMNDFDALVLMPASWMSGASYEDFLNDSSALHLVRAADSSGKAIWATCAGVRVLAKAGVLNGHQVVGTSMYQSEYEAAGAVYLGDDHPPVVDGNIVTCVRDMYYHVKNCEALAQAIEKLPAKTGKKIKYDPDFTMTPVSLSGALWAWAIGGPEADIATSLIRTSDGGFALTGCTYSSGTADPDIFLVKADSGGILEWSRLYPCDGWQCAYGLAETSDSGFIISGYTSSQGSRDIRLIRTDRTGDTIWTKTIGDSLTEVGRSVILSQDGGFVIGGYSDSRGSGEDDFYMVRTDSLGDTLWTSVFGGTRSDMGRSILPMEDGFALAGATGSPELSTNNQDYYLLRTDRNGQKIWGKGYGTTSTLPFDWANHITRASDGGFLLVGESSYNIPLNICAVRTDSSGNMKWRKFFGYASYDYGNGACAADSGGFMICGSSKSGTPLQNDLYIIRLDSLGSQKWSMLAGGAGNDWGSAICRATDGNYVAGGYTNSYGTGSYDILLAKIGKAGPSGVQTGYPLPAPGKTMLKAFPNPFGTKASIEFQTPGSSRVDIGIYNVTGQKVCQLYDGPASGDRHNLQWNGLDQSGQHVSSGIYLCRLATEKSSLWLKLVKLP